MREALEPLVEDLIHLRLDEGVAARPAEFVGARLDGGKALAGCGVKAHPVVGRDVGLHLLGKARSLQRAQRLVINADGARVVDHGVQFFNHCHAHAREAQGVGNGQPDGARTDDDDVCRIGVLGRLVLGSHQNVSLQISVVMNVS
ncbi:hypothetical protein SDC9_106564 [bioreactor metagenome]|uniref:Uncharacterized protein n=1 Tax=bioreactor metagenome TaxID=1076179 RepID=A0A645B3V1_9ZZZZ